MKKWYTLLDVFSFPLKMLFIAIIMMGLGDFFLNPNIIPYINITNQIFLTVCRILRFTGSVILGSFPLLLVIKILARRYEDSVPAFNGTVGYIIFNIVTMFSASTKLPSYCYSSIMGLSVTTASTITSAGLTRYPLVTGLIGTLIVVGLTKVSYSRSRRRFTYGILSFIDNDAWSLISTMLYTALAGLAVSFAWPFFISSLQNIFDFIGADIYNPANMFIYGVAERFLTAVDLQDLIHNPFWFGTLGGSWMDTFGKSYTGDVGIWTALVTQNSSTLGYGRFITPYYILNLFAVPGMLIGIFSLISDKLQRRRYLLFFILAILVSILSGMLWPLELFLAVAAPMLFLMHVLLTGALYAVFTSMTLALGYTYSGTLAYAMPGTLISLLPFLSKVNYLNTLLILLGFGILYFMIYLGMTRLYYKVLAGDFLDRKNNLQLINDFIAAAGGIANIRIINSAINYVAVHLYNPTLLSQEAMKDLGAYRITDSRSGLRIEFGARSTIIKNGTRKAQKKYKEEQAAKPVPAAGAEVEG